MKAGLLDLQRQSDCNIAVIAKWTNFELPRKVLYAEYQPNGEDPVSASPIAVPKHKVSPAAAQAHTACAMACMQKRHNRGKACLCTRSCAITGAAWHTHRHEFALWGSWLFSRVYSDIHSSSDLWQHFA